MNIWIDDFRQMPKGFDIWCKTAEQAIDEIRKNNGNIGLVSFDHDLGFSRFKSSEWNRLNTGYIVASWVEEMAFFLK